MTAEGLGDRECMGTVTLREYEDQVADLSDLDATFIEVNLARKIQIRRQTRGRSFILNPSQFVGVVPLPSGTVLESRPKIPIKNLFYMLAVAFQLPSFQPEVAALDRLDQLLEFVANYFADLVEKKIANGLYRWYVENEDNLTSIRGRIQIVEDCRRNYVVRQNTFCRFDEFSWDIPENQVVRQVSHFLSGWEFQIDTRFRLGRIDSLMDEVSRTTFSASDVDKFHYHRLNADYEQLHQLCSLFLDGASLSETAGIFSFRAFLIDMNKLFEKFVCQVVAERLVMPLVAEFQKRIFLDRGEKISMRPDLLIRDASGVLLAADCKYKKMINNEAENQDYYQLLAYCTAMKTDRGLVVYPLHQTIEDRAIEEGASIVNSKIWIETVSIDLSQDLKKLSAECDSFALKVVECAQQKVLPKD